MRRIQAVRRLPAERLPNPVTARDAIRDFLVEIVRESIRAEFAESERQDAKAAPVLLERHELAPILKISLSSLDRLRAERGFPELRVGDAPRFLLADVLEYLRTRGQVR